MECSKSVCTNATVCSKATHTMPTKNSGCMYRSTRIKAMRVYWQP